MKKNDVIKIIVFAIILIGAIGITIWMFPIMKSLLTPEGRLGFKTWLDSLGVLKIFVLFGLQVLQIFLVFLPGEPIEIMAGVCYGSIWGSVFIMVSAFVITTAIVFLVKKYGRSFVELFFKKDKLDKIENSNFFKNEKKLELMFIILFFIPGTPKDFLTYVGGLTKIKPLRFILIATIARFPSVISSTVVGDNILEGNAKYVLITYAITFLFTIVVMLLVNIFDKNNVTKNAIDSMK